MNLRSKKLRERKEFVVIDKRKRVDTTKTNDEDQNKIKKLEKKVKNLQEKIKDEENEHNKRAQIKTNQNESKISKNKKNKISRRLQEKANLNYIKDKYADLKSKESKKKQIDKLAALTQDTLFKTSAVFPFDFFPNEVIIEKKQIILVYKQFIRTQQEYNVLIQDLLMPIVEMSPFFAKLKLELGPGAFQQNPPPISFLKRGDAEEVKKIIQGLLICHKEKIDITDMNKDDIVKKTSEIGDHD